MNSSRAARQAEQRGWRAPPLAPAELARLFPELWGREKAAQRYLEGPLAKAWFELHRCDLGNPRSPNTNSIAPSNTDTPRPGEAVDERDRPSVLAALLGVDPITLEMRPFCEDAPKRNPCDRRAICEPVNLSAFRRAGGRRATPSGPHWFNNSNPMRRWRAAHRPPVRRKPHPKQTCFAAHAC
jgi:hypothetical protein